MEETQRIHKTIRRVEFALKVTYWAGFSSLRFHLKRNHRRVCSGYRAESDTKADCILSSNG